MSSQGFKLLEVAEAKGAVGVCVCARAHVHTWPFPSFMV